MEKHIVSSIFWDAMVNVILVCRKACSFDYQTYAGPWSDRYGPVCSGVPLSTCQNVPRTIWGERGGEEEEETYGAFDRWQPCEQ